MSRRLPRGVNSLACQREACQEVPSRGWWSPCTVTVRQREGTKKMRRVGSKSLFNVTGNPPPYLTRFPRCPSVIGLRPWVLKERLVRMWWKARL